MAIKMTNSQFTTANHITYHKHMPMSADCEKDSSDRKKGEHLFASFRPCISPALNTGVHALRQIVHLRHVQPSNIVIIITIIGVGNGLRCGGWGSFSLKYTQHEIRASQQSGLTSNATEEEVAGTAPEVEYVA